MSLSKENLTAKLKEVHRQLSYWPRTLRLIWQGAPKWTSAWAVLLVIQGFLPALSIYLTKLLVDHLVLAINAKGQWQEVWPTLILVGITATVMLLADVLQGLSDWIRTAQSELIQDHIKNLTHHQAVTLDLSFYESSDYHDLLERVRSEASSRPLALLESCGSLIQNGLTLIAMAVVLMTYNPLLPLILLLSTAPAFYVVLRFDRRYHDWWRQTTSDRRRIEYCDFLLTHHQAATELRLFNLGSQFQSTYKRLRTGLRTARLAQLRKQSIAKLAAGTAALTVAGGTMIWMVYRAFQGLITIGDLALFYQAFNRGQGLMRSLLNSVGQVYTNTLFLEHLFTFLDINPKLSNPDDPAPILATLKEGIQFKSVTFRYPGSARAALQDFSFYIPAGKVIAIVGPNGAGKSTLLKLICRFYEQEAGNIEIDGVDIRQFSETTLRQMLTVLFQFPLNYHATVAENITFGDLATANDRAAIESAARSAGAHQFITELPDGYDTMLGKWLANGVELSGGEWQRIAMARAFVRRSPIIILDEPTSFMDSWAEAEWFERFRALAENRTAIIITHRFTIAMRADVIYVMDKSEIVESGSHHELLSQEGLYARSWAAQMRSHLDGDEVPVGKGELERNANWEEARI
jgi:ATP-binding cassette subfamily B protein